MSNYQKMIDDLKRERDLFVNRTNEQIDEQNQTIEKYTAIRTQLLNVGQQKVYEYNGRIQQLEILLKQETAVSHENGHADNLELSAEIIGE